MIRWLIFTAVVVANLAVAFVALAPGAVTYAEIAPVGVTCSTCSNPEVQAALIRAAAAGRAQIISLIDSSARGVIAVATLNIVLAGALLLRLRTNAETDTNAPAGCKLYGPMPFAVTAAAGAICLVVSYDLTRGGNTIFAIMVVAIIGAASGLIAAALCGEKSNLRILLLIFAFVIGAFISEAVAFAHYYGTYGFQDPKFGVGVVLSIAEFAIISAVGSLAIFAAVWVKKRSIALRSREAAQ
jgi:hypothetical protein